MVTAAFGVFTLKEAVFALVLGSRPGGHAAGNGMRAKMSKPFPRTEVKM